MSNLASMGRQDNLEGWLQQVNRICGRFGASQIAGEFHGGISEYRGRLIKMSFVEVSGARLFRSARDVSADDGKHYFATFQLSGQAQMEQAENRVLLSPGDITLIDSCRPCIFTFGQSSRQLSLILPREVVDRNLSFSRIACARRIAGESPAALLASRLIADVAEQDELSQAESEATLDAVVTLLRPVLAAPESVDSHERAFARALTVIEREVRNPALSPASLAAEIGVSVRGLYRLFAARGLVVAQFIRSRRLELCAQALRHAGSEQKLSVLALDCGFADSSHFSTAFRQHFGMTPGDYRRRHGRPGVAGHADAQ